jgi:hypothetical protein
MFHRIGLLIRTIVTGARATGHGNSSIGSHRKIEDLLWISEVGQLPDSSSAEILGPEILNAVFVAYE